MTTNKQPMASGKETTHMPDTFIKALECVVTFLEQNNFDFTITGTTALMTQGLLPVDYAPHDIDVLVYSTTKEQHKMLREMEDLAGLTNESYRDNTTSYTVLANGVKLNILCSRTTREEPIESDLYNILYWAGHKVKVQYAYEALKAKLRLRRPKDFVFFNTLISEIWNSSTRK